MEVQQKGTTDSSLEFSIVSNEEYHLNSKNLSVPTIEEISILNSLSATGEGSTFRSRKKVKFGNSRCSNCNVL